MAKSKEKSHSSKDKDKTNKKKDKSKDRPTSSPAVELDNGIDPALDSLFSHSSGPVKPRTANNVVTAEQVAVPDAEREYESEGPNEDVVAALAASRDALSKPGKKKRKRDSVAMVENDYLDKLIEEGGKSSTKKKRKEADNSKESDTISGAGVGKAEVEEEEEEEAEVEEADAMDIEEDQPEKTSHEDQGHGGGSANDSSSDDDDDKDENTPIMHESLARPSSTADVGGVDMEKAKRTVFIGNLPPSVITAKGQKSQLENKLKSYGPLESIRFRSIAFSDLIPRKAAFVTKALHADISSINAYAVFKTTEAARTALKLNSQVVLDRHLRVDSVAHPSKHDSKRAVFVGNLDFEACEESLWRHFSSCGDVENVRIVRDPKTNVGKGIAYVSFADATSVEAALLLNEKPMKAVNAKDEEAVKKAAKRKLRVLRSKNLSKKHHSKKQESGTNANGALINLGKKGAYVPKHDPRKLANLGRAGRLLGKAGAAKMKKAPAAAELAVFEGVRASKNTDPGIRKGGTGKKKGKPRVRARTSAWKQKAKV